MRPLGGDLNVSQGPLAPFILWQTPLRKCVMHLYGILAGRPSPSNSQVLRCPQAPPITGQPWPIMTAGPALAQAGHAQVEAKTPIPEVKGGSPYAYTPGPDTTSIFSQ